MCLLACMSLAACASKRSVKEIRATEPECTKAEDQLKMLDKEMVATHERALAGVASVVPSLAALSVLSGRYKTNFAIATGSYERALDDKIDEIRKACGLQGMIMKSDDLKKVDIESGTPISFNE